MFFFSGDFGHVFSSSIHTKNAHLATSLLLKVISKLCAKVTASVNATRVKRKKLEKITNIQKRKFSSSTSFVHLRVAAGFFLKNFSMLAEFVNLVQGWKNVTEWAGVRR